MAKYTGYKDIEARKKYNRKYQREYIIKYRHKMKLAGKQLASNAPEYTQRLRVRALKIIGNSCCENCGCTVTSLLEINHKNGGGGQQRKVRTAKQFYLDIIYGRVDVKELNILCKVCNIQHYVEKLLGIKGHKVTWNAPL